MTNSFLCLNPPEERLFYPEWGPGENIYLTSIDGNFHPHRFERPFQCIIRKHQVADILWPGGNVCLISNHVRDLFQAASVTGVEYSPTDVRLMFPHDRKDAVYWQISVSGWCGIAPPESGIHRVHDPSREGQLLYSAASNLSAILDTKQWDGSDFSCVWPFPNYWWVTPKVVEILTANRLKRFRLLSSEELTVLTKPTGGIGFMPGRLRLYFNDERARLIGEPLGIY